MISTTALNNPHTTSLCHQEQVILAGAKVLAERKESAARLWTTKRQFNFTLNTATRLSHDEPVSKGLRHWLDNRRFF